MDLHKQFMVRQRKGIALHQAFFRHGACMLRVVGLALDLSGCNLITFNTNFHKSGIPSRLIFMS